MNPTNPDLNLLRGHLDLILLSLIRGQAKYSLEISKLAAQHTGGYFDLKVGSLYPALHRLEKAGFLRSEFQAARGNTVKVYELTESGQKELDARKQDFQRFTDWYVQDATGKRIRSGSLKLAVNSVQADANGQATFRIYPATQPFKVVNTEAQFLRLTQPYLHNYAYWSDDDPAPALLLELTGKFGPDAYKVLPPGSWK